MLTIKLLLVKEPTTNSADEEVSHQKKKFIQSFLPMLVRVQVPHHYRDVILFHPQLVQLVEWKVCKGTEKLKMRTQLQNEELMGQNKELQTKFNPWKQNILGYKKNQKHLMV